MSQMLRFNAVFGLFFLMFSTFGQATTKMSLGYPDAKKGGTISLRMPSYPKTLNLFISDDAYARQAFELVVEPLIDRDYDTFAEVPRLAESWQLAPDKLSVIFKINPRAKWSDGTPVTADDVVFTWDTIFNEKLPTAPLRSFLEPIKSWTKIDDHSVKFEFKHVDFLNLSKAGNQEVMQKSVYSKGDIVNDFNQKLVGSGPYTFDAAAFQKGSKIVLQKNKNWWGANEPRLKNMYNYDKVILNVIEDERVAFEAFKKGDLTMLMFVADGLDIWAKEVANNPAYDNAKYGRLVYPYANPSSWSGIALNMRRAPTNDLKFRQALQLLFNREMFTKKIFHGLQIPILGPFGNFSDYASKNRKMIPFDPAKAKKLLAEAGYKKTDEKGVLFKEENGQKISAKVQILFAYAPHEKYLTLYKEDARKAGVEIELKLMEWASMQKIVDDFKFDAMVLSWSGDPIPEVTQLFSGKYANDKGTSNKPGLNDPEVDRMMAEAPGIFDHAKQIKMFHAIEDRLISQQPYIWRWQQKDHYYLYNKEKIKIPKKVYKYSGTLERMQPWIYWSAP